MQRQSWMSRKHVQGNITLTLKSRFMKAVYVNAMHRVHQHDSKRIRQHLNESNQLKSGR